MMTRRLSRFVAASSLLGLIALAGASVTDESHSLMDDPAMVGEPVVLVTTGGRTRVTRAPQVGAQPVPQGYPAPQAYPTPQGYPAPQAYPAPEAMPAPVPVYPPSGPVPPRS